MLSILKVEIDGHFHGSSDVPQPWVARILGPDPKYGLAREFVQKMNDWKDARRAFSGNVYGRVAHFPLRDGELYEVARLRGKSSKRHMAREFIAIENGKRVELDTDEALLRAIGGGTAAPLTIDEDESGRSWVAAIQRLGTPERQGFVVDGGMRRYLLRAGLYEVMECGVQRFVGMRDQMLHRLSTDEAFAWLGR